jgi:tripartite-type tricarboxylate transporter receptor subunit TctC
MSFVAGGENVMSRMRRTIAAVLVVVPAAALSQQYPSKPIRAIVPYPPGGVDITTRLLQPMMQEDLGQPIVIENRPGNGGVLGSEFTARQAPDGYVLLMTTSNSHVNAPATQKNMPYDPIKDFAAITNVFSSPNVIILHPSVPAGSISELVAYAKRNPGKLSYGSSGMGGVQHIEMEQLKQLAGIDIVHIPYNGFGPMVPALLGNQIQLGVGTAEFAKPLSDSGKLKVIGTTSRQRTDLFPGAASAVEAYPSWQSGPSWVGWFGPAGLPRPIVTRLHGAIVKALATASVQQRFREVGNVSIGNTPEQFSAQIQRELEEMKQMVKTLGIPLQE